VTVAESPINAELVQDRSLRGMAIANAGAWLALAVGGIATTAILYRVLGPATYGVWATVAALRAFALFLDGGLMFGASGAAARFRSDPDRARADLRGSMLLGLASGACVAVAAILLAWVPAALLGLEGASAGAAALATGLIGLEVGLALAASPVHGMARGLERFDAIALGALIQASVVIVFVLVLTPTMGLVGAAAALIIGRVAGTLPVLATVRRTEPSFLGLDGATKSVGRSIWFAGPLWLISIGTQLSLGTDVPIVGRFFGAVAAGAYAIGAIVPATALSALYALTDSSYPRLARQEPSTSHLVRRLIVVATALAGLGFTVMAALAPQILVAWIGTAESLAVDVLRIYSLTWALNVPAHILALHAMASWTHRALVPIVLGEAVASFVLSIVLASLGWPIGPAVATLVTLALSNLLIVPWLTLPRAGIPPRTAAMAAIIGYGAGVSAGAVVVAIALASGLTPVPTLGIATALTLIAAAGIVMLTVIRPGATRRITSVLRNGGLAVWLRQRQEVRDARVRLEHIRAEQPVVWVPSAQPLVSVRIATYNRGAIVRDRAIASALAQTHSNIEIVVVGDRCDAATEAAVRSVDDPRVRFENLAERGRYPADPQFRWMVAGSTPMNRALDLARGDWIAPLDDDDEFTPDHVEALLDACRTRDLELAYGIAESEVEPGVWEAVGSAPLRHGHIIHAAVMFRRAIGFIRHDIESWRLYEPGDWNVWHRMRDAGVKIGFVDHVVTRHHLERRELR
jgi:O-antigen/teichoic acid export membrane protein